MTFRDSVCKKFKSKTERDNKFKDRDVCVVAPLLVNNNRYYINDKELGCYNFIGIVDHLVQNLC